MSQHNELPKEMLKITERAKIITYSAYSDVRAEAPRNGQSVVYDDSMARLDIGDYIIAMYGDKPNKEHFQRCLKQLPPESKNKILVFVPDDFFGSPEEFSQKTLDELDIVVAPKGERVSQSDAKYYKSYIESNNPNHYLVGDTIQVKEAYSLIMKGTKMDEQQKRILKEQYWTEPNTRRLLYAIYAASANSESANLKLNEFEAFYSFIGYLRVTVRQLTNLNLLESGLSVPPGSLPLFTKEGILDELINKAAGVTPNQLSTEIETLHKEAAFATELEKELEKWLGKPDSKLKEARLGVEHWFYKQEDVAFTVFLKGRCTNELLVDRASTNAQQQKTVYGVENNIVTVLAAPSFSEEVIEKSEELLLEVYLLDGIHLLEMKKRTPSKKPDIGKFRRYVQNPSKGGLIPHNFIDNIVPTSD